MMNAYDRTVERHWLARVAPLLTCILAAFGSLQPFITGQVPMGADTALHYFRISAWERLWAQGIVYTQWMPDLALGYGYPLTAYHPPLAYYLAVLMARIGFSLPHAMLAAWVLSAVVATTGMFQWVHSLSRSTLAGVVAAVAYAFAPYTLNNIFTRGGFPESIAISMAPWLFFAIHRYTQQHQFRFGLLLTLSFTAILLTHVIVSLLMAPLVVVLILVGAWNWHGAQARLGAKSIGSFVRPLLFPILGGAGFVLLALGLAAFFWLPPQFELGLVQMARGTSGYANFSEHFLSLGQLLAPPNPVDPNFIGQSVPSSLSWLALALTVPALVHVARSDRPADHVLTLTLALITLTACFMTLAVSQFVWEHITILRYLQYPFRFLGIATLTISAVAGIGAAIGYTALKTWLGRRMHTIEPLMAMALFVLVAGFAVYAYTWQITKPDPLANNPNVTATDIWQAEQRLGTIGTTSFGEYLPISVHQMPTAPAFTDTLHPDRLDYASLPAGATVVSASYGALAYDLVIQTPRIFTLTLHTFYFPGWVATVDGASSTIVPSVPNGLMQVRIPAGRHRLYISFSHTPIRAFSTDLSLIALLVLAGVISRAFMHQHKGQKGSQSPSQQSMPPVAPMVDEADRPSALQAGPIVAVVLALLAAFGYKTAFVDAGSTLFKYTHLSDHRVLGASNDFDVNFGNMLHLIGGDIPHRSIKAGQTLNFSLYWQLYQPTTSDFSIKTDVVSPRGIDFGHYDTQHPNGIFPTSRFTPTDYILDERHIAIAADAPPGVYQVKASVYYKGQPDHRLTVLNNSGAPVGTTYEATAATLFTITVNRPDQPEPLSQVKPPTPVNLTIGDGVVLIGHSLPAQLDLHVGDSFSVETYWHALQKPVSDMNICFDLALPDQLVPLTCQAPVPGLPTSQWQAGDVWHSAQAMRIPPALAGGVYTLTLRSERGGKRFTLSTFTISAPKRISQLPAGLFSQPNQFVDGITLAGYNITPQDNLSTGQTLTVTLYWRTNRELDARLKAFVQVLDATSNRVTGNDQIPGGVRPTTDWVPGEVVPDAHTMSLPQGLAPGQYQLLVGLYDEGNLKRVPLDNGKDALLLTTPIKLTR